MKGTSLIEILVSLIIFQTSLLGAGFWAIQSLHLTNKSLVLTQHVIQKK